MSITACEEHRTVTKQQIQGIYGLLTLLVALTVGSGATGYWSLSTSHEAAQKVERQAAVHQEFKESLQAQLVGISQRQDRMATAQDRTLDLLLQMQRRHDGP